MSESLYCEEGFLPVTPGDLSCSEVLDMFKTPIVNSSSSQNLPPRSSENSSALPVKALMDPALLKDKILQNLLRLEDQYLPSSPDYFIRIQEDITPSMRKIVGDWMLSLCQELQSQPEVFCLSMNYMDRFLAKVPVDKSKLQLVGAVCLLLSSKFRDTRPILGERLIFYTDFSITSDEIKDWELLVLGTLSWELAAITPLDFLDQIIPRIGLSRSVDLESLKQRAETIIVLSLLEYDFSYCHPSLLASSSILSALKSLTNDPKVLIKDVTSFREIKLRIQTLVHVVSNDVDICMKQMEHILPDYLKASSGNVEIALADSSTTSKMYSSSSSSASSVSSSSVSSSSVTSSSHHTKDSELALQRSKDYGFLSSSTNNDLSDNLSILVS